MLYLHNYVCMCHLELPAASQSKDIEPFILQRLSFSVTPECKLP